MIDATMLHPDAAAVRPDWWSPAGASAPGPAPRSMPSAPRRCDVPRTALIERLRSRAHVPLVAVVAPAGYGKTTLLLQVAARDPRPCAWVSLDERDDEPSRLAARIAQAVSETCSAHPCASPGAPRPLAVGRDPAAPIGTPGAGVLVLDDLHVVRDPAAQQVVADVVQQLPPGWQLAVAGRERPALPIARLRAEGRVVEVGPDDLALDDHEARQLVAAAGVRGSAAAALLTGAVEGWPAAVSLAALACEAGTVPEAEGPVLQGADRFLIDYVRDEVLAALEPADIDVLMLAAVCERLSGPLCDAVLGTTGSAARLDGLDRRHMLVTALDRMEGWYRCRALLRHVLEGELHRRAHAPIPELRRRAADWYEANGLRDDAIEQVIALGDGSRVVRLVTASAWPSWVGGRAVAVRRWLDWIDQQRLVVGDPALAVVGALVHRLDGRAVAATRWVEAAEAAGAQETAEGRSRLALVRALGCGEGIEAAVGDAELAGELGAPDDPLRGAAMLARGIAHLVAGAHDRADAALADAAEVAADAGTAPIAVMAAAERALLALRAGRCSDARTVAEQACAWIQRDGLGSYGISALPLAVAARIRLEQGDLDGAKAAATSAQRLHPHLSHSMPCYAVQARLELARCYAAMTDAAGARATLRDAVLVLQRRPRLGTLVDDVDAVKRQVDALRTTMAGASSLTAAELRLLPLLATHLSFRGIGERLFISPNTVKAEAISIYRKLGVSSRGGAIERAEDLGLLAGVVA